MVAVPVDHRLGLGAIDSQAIPDSLGLVVLSTHQSTAALVADRARVAPHVRRLAALTNGAPAQSLYQLVVDDVEQQHLVDALPDLGQGRAEPLGLRHRA